MWIGLMTDSLRHRPRDEVLDACVRWGIQSVELGTGNFSPAPHLDLEALLRDEGERTRLLREVRDRGLRISALNCSGNPLHPRPEVASRHTRVVRDTVALAGLLEVDTVVTMSGCPGSPGSGDVPNWVVSTWPQEFVETVEWQWRERVVPFWQQMAEWAARNRVRIAVEMHPGQCVYNPPTLLRLRDAVGPVVGANLDPSHLFWQGVDVMETVRRLGALVFHVHAKDTRVDDSNVRRNGVLHMTPGRPVPERPWAFCTLGLGHDAFFWTRFVDFLQQIGYRGALSIEHEDEILAPEDGVLRSVRLLRGCLPQEPESDARGAHIGRPGIRARVGRPHGGDPD